MKKVKTQQKYKCDFCNKRGVKWRIEEHEKQCYRNPKRKCPECGSGFKESNLNCTLCGGFDLEQLEEIEDREKGKKRNKDNDYINPDEIPF